MHRFYCLPEDIKDGYAHIGGDELQHLARVLRLGNGDAVVLFDGNGTEYTGTIESLQKTEALVKIESFSKMCRESSLNLWLCQGIPKGEKMELIIQKATELGVHGIIPLETGRTVVKLEEKKKVQRQVRWQKVAVEAVKQCRRTVVPKVLLASKIQEFLSGFCRESILLIPWEEGGKPLKTVLQDKETAFREGKPVCILIGPEGGLEEREVALAQTVGGIPVTLGPRILRTETAGLAVLAAVMYQWGDLG